MENKRKSKTQRKKEKGTICVTDPDQGSEIGFPDPGSQPYNFESLVTIVWLKSSTILCKLVQIFLNQFKNKIIFNFVIFVATKKVGQLNFFGIQDGQKSGSGINIPDPQHWEL